MAATLALEAVHLDAGGVLIVPQAGRLADALSPLGITAPDRAILERAHSLARGRWPSARMHHRR